MHKSGFIFIILLVISGLAAAELNVRSFGARGDGETDDTEAIKTAFAELKKQGGTLSFAPGRYAFRGLLKFSELKNAVVDFNGATMVNLEQKGSFHFDKCENFTVTGGVLTYQEMPARQQTSAQHPIYMTNGVNIRVENVHILGSPFMGIAINGCRFVWVVNNKIERTQRDGLHFVFSQDIVATGNYITQTTDDALALIDYGHENALRLQRAVISNNMIYNCRQGLVCLGGKDVIFANNHVEKTTFSGCQITTNDRFNNKQKGACSASRIKVTGNRFVESGADFEINGELIRNSGQVTTGRAGIVVAYICREKGWCRNGDEYFSSMDYPALNADGQDYSAAADMIEELFPGRKIQLFGGNGQAVPATVKTSQLRDGKTVFTTDAAVEKLSHLKLSRIITDIEIIDNEILNSHVNGIYTNGVYRLRVINNKILNANRSASKWTGQIVEILNGNQVDFLYNWIQENGTEKRHRKPLTITAANTREIGTRID